MYLLYGATKRGNLIMNNLLSYKRKKTESQRERRRRKGRPRLPLNTPTFTETGLYKLRGTLTVPLQLKKGLLALDNLKPSGLWRTVVWISSGISKLASTRSPKGAPVLDLGGVSCGGTWSSSWSRSQWVRRHNARVIHVGTNRGQRRSRWGFHLSYSVAD